MESLNPRKTSVNHFSIYAKPKRASAEATAVIIQLTSKQQIRQLRAQPMTSYRSRIQFNFKLMDSRIATLTIKGKKARSLMHLHCLKEATQ